MDKQMKVDLLLTNGNIRTMDQSETVARWVAIHDGKIVSMGLLDGDMPQSSHQVDLANRTVLPGFIDSHAHGTLTGISLLSADCRDASSLDDVLQSLKEKSKVTPEGDLITGTNLSAETLKERRLPTRKELDAVSSTHPIQLHHVTMHGCVLNSMAMGLSGVTPGMRGVEIYEDGSANGIISDDTAYLEACARISSATPASTVEAYIRSFADSVLAQGVTTVHSLDAQDLPSEPELWQKIRGTLPIHVINYVESLDVDWVRNLGYPRVGGCICLDGSRIMKTMALNQPYRNSQDRGVLYYDDETVYQFMSKAHAYGMQFAMHAAGDRAIDQYINAYAKVVKAQGCKDLRHRIEHFTFPSQHAIEMAVEHQFALPMQPSFTDLWDNPNHSVYADIFGRERADRFEAFHDILQMGGKICGGSDSPITPVDPLNGIHICVNAPNPRRRLSITEAIQLFTINGAWAAHEDKDKGTIEVGKLADLTVLSADPYDIPDKIRDICVEMTIVEGKLAYMAATKHGI
jgi:predicted amidohydrolase YtcJ